MFNNQPFSHHSKSNLHKTQIFNYEDKENYKACDHNLDNKIGIEQSHTPIVIFKNSEKETSPFKRNLNSTEYTTNFHNISRSDVKVGPTNTLRDNPFFKFDLDNYVKNFTSPRKNNVEETVILSKHNFCFKSLVSFTASKEKPKLTQYESKKISLEFSKQKNIISKQTITKHTLKKSEFENESKNKISVVHKTNIEFDSQNSKNSVLSESNINSNKCLVLTKSEIKEINSIINFPCSNDAESYLDNNHAITGNSYKNKNSENRRKTEGDETNFDIPQKEINIKETNFSELEKNLFVSKERRNDEVYKLLKIKKTIRKPEVSVSSSAKKITDMRKVDEDCLIDDAFDYNILSRKKKVHSVKKVFCSEIKLYNEKLKGYKTFKIFRDSDIGINPYWQSHLISTDQDDDVESDDEQIEMAYLYTLEQLRIGYLTLLKKIPGSLRNEVYITGKK